MKFGSEFTFLYNFSLFALRSTYFELIDLYSHSENKSGDVRKSEKYKDLKKNQSAIASVGFAKVAPEKLGSFGIS